MDKGRSLNEGFGVKRGVVSWDTSQEFGSSLPVRAFVKPRPTPSPDTLAASGATVRQTTIEWLTALESFVLRESFRESRQFDSVKDNKARPVKPLEQEKNYLLM